MEYTKEANKSMTVKNRIATSCFLLIALVLGSSAMLFAQETGKPLSQGDATTSRVEASLRLMRRLPDRWEFELTAQNTGGHAVFIMTEPVRSNGLKGPFLTLDQHDQSVLELGIQLYKSPDYCIYSNQTGVTLKRLEPGATHVEQVTVTFPAKETIPPYKTTPLDHVRIDTAKLSAVRATIGMLPNDEGVQDYFRRRESIGRPYASAHHVLDEGPLKGKELREVQEIIRTPIIKL